MPSGLRNAPATLSRLVVKLLRGLDELSGAYMDDIISCSLFWKEHASYTRVVLTPVQHAHLSLSPTKYQFSAADLDYLGQHVALVESSHKV